MLVETYINSDIVEQMRLKVILKQEMVNVLNSQVKPFETLPVEFNLESLNGKIKLSGYTTDRVAGNMRPINWKKYKDKLRHLKNINLHFQRYNFQ